MDYILSEDELQALRDEAQNAKEEFQALAERNMDLQNRILKTNGLCDEIIRIAKTCPDDFWQGRRVAAMDVLLSLKEGDS